jgi:glycosyltransferase involved in cell wall biosynthesis
MHLIKTIRAIPFLNRRLKDKINIFISIYPQNKGGGSNTFSYNFKKWVLRNKEQYHLVYNILKSDKAIIIADKMDIQILERAKKQGCFIIHRLDEHVEPYEDEYRKKKHAYIKELNRLADITVFQSRFVFENMHPYLDYPERYEIIYNGAYPEEFYPSDKAGDFIGHITWGVGEKKRLDILYETIKQNPDEKFLLIGNHKSSNLNFTSLPNAACLGQITRDKILQCLHQMKFLFFPSENDPCPNTVIEAIMAGVPVCYNLAGGTKELVKDCGLPIEEFLTIKKEWKIFRERCFNRTDLHFDNTARKYMGLN